MGKEIERKWILTRFPDQISEGNHWKVEQLYVSLYPEVRFRKKFDYSTGQTDYKLTAKSRGSLVRSEFETKIDELIWSEGLAAAGEPIVKDFYKFNYEGHTYEVSQVDDAFIYVEVEFESVEEANAFEFPFPELVNMEATHNTEYKMRQYWMRKHAPMA